MPALGALRAASAPREDAALLDLDRSFRFLYVDDARTHQVTTEVRREASELVLDIVEAPFGSRDPADLVAREERIREPWEIRLALKELEARLALSGAAYDRFDPQARAWTHLPPVQRGVCDVRAHEVPLPDERGRKLRFHHFHHREGDSRLLLTLPRTDLPAERYLLANLDFRFPRVGEGDLTLLHARLAPGTLRAQWVNTHLNLPKEGFRKLVSTSDYATAFGAGWQETWRRSFRSALARLLEGDLGRRAPPDASGRAVETAGDLALALRSPVLRAIRSRFLAQGEEAQLVHLGELPIRRTIQQRRRTTGHDEQAQLSLLEAALLVAYARRTGATRLAEEEGARVVRMVREFERARAVARA